MEQKCLLIYYEIKKTRALFLTSKKQYLCFRFKHKQILKMNRQIFYTPFTRFLLSILYLSVIAPFTYAQKLNQTGTCSEHIKSIQLIVNNDLFRPPIIELQSNDIVSLKFDNLNVDKPHLRYRLVHCEADGTPSTLSEMEYMQGFNDQPIEDFRFSENTTVNYIHYSLNIPNEAIEPTVSGNYKVEVFTADNPDSTILQVEFVVVEPMVHIQASMSGNTDIDIQKAHQQLHIEVSHEALSLRDATQEIKVCVYQNNRFSEKRMNIHPSFVFPNRIVFEHQAGLIFEGGNEYRRFETINKASNGLNVASTSYKSPYVRIQLLTDKCRADHRRQYDEDQNGRYFIRNTQGYDANVDADYFMVHFTMASAPFKQPLYLDIASRYIPLTYNSSIEAYEAEILLKQGSYNYQFVTKDENGYSTQHTEGSFFDTENEYIIIIYHHPPGQRYDKAVGWKWIGKQRPNFLTN